MPLGLIWLWGNLFDSNVNLNIIFRLKLAFGLLNLTSTLYSDGEKIREKRIIGGKNFQKS